ncbi:MAG: aldo/keto reductase [Firmicutes bacterium]|nr:aldo/keto reductase [Bacillota bacterium]
MEYRYMGKANVKVSTICLGTMHFGGRTDEKEAFRIMDRAVEIGINFFDTANVYGGAGRTEEIIGRWFQQGGGRRDRVVLATKVYGQMVREEPVPPNEERGLSLYKVKKHVEGSLRRLQTDHIDLYQVHHIDRHISPEEFWTIFDTLVTDGKVLYTGTSNFPGWGLAKFQMAAEKRGSLGIVSEQAQYNLLSRYPELEVIPAAQEFGIGIMVYMPLAGGLLTGKTKREPGSRTQAVADEYGIGARMDDLLREFSQLCRDLGEPEHVVALAWTLATPGVYSAIVGARTAEHLDGLERASELQLPNEVVQRLNDLFHIRYSRPLKAGPAPEAFAW